MIEVKVLRQNKDFSGRKVLVERTGVLGVKVVLHHPDLFCSGVGIFQGLHKKGIFFSVALPLHPCQGFAAQRFNATQQGTGAVLLKAIMLLSDIATL